MYHYNVETNEAVAYYWQLNISFKFDRFDENDYIQFYRTDNGTRILDVKIFKNQIILISKEQNKCKTYNHNIILTNTYVNIKIISNRNIKVIISTSDSENEFIFDDIYSSGLESYINATIPIIDYNIKYLNIKPNIPMVFGDCFTNLHTHKMFGKYLYENGSNYYCFNKPSIKNIDIFYDKIIEIIDKCHPKKVYILCKSYIENRKDTFNCTISKYNKIYESFKDREDLEIVICTMPHKLESNSKYNEFVRNQGWFKYIDFDKQFENLNKDDYFIDNAHTNEEGAKLLYERIKQDAPDLCKHYVINFNDT